MQESVRLIIFGWKQFWFAEGSTVSLERFRVAFGCFLLLVAAVSFPNWLRFYGPEGLLPVDILRHEGLPGAAAGLFRTTTATWALFGLWVAAGISFTFGFRTRLAAICLYLVALLLMRRNPLLVYGQDMVTVMLLFFCLFAPWGKINRRVSLWVVRLMQVAVASVYLFSFLTKMIFPGSNWIDGTAVYYLSFSRWWFRFPGVPFLHNIWFSRILSYVTLTIEASFPILVWFPGTKRHVLALMAAMHLGIMILMSTGVFFFNLVMIISLLLFLEPSRLRRLP